MQLAVHDALKHIARDEWNAIAGDAYPFLRHEFLVAAEESRCVADATGWQPSHLTIRDDAGSLRAAMPLYEKNHSWGEFVFDWAWANAYERAGLDYYPKLVSTIPFTPAPSPRLLLADKDDSDAANKLIAAAVALAKERGCSSLHVLFPAEREIAVLAAAGLKIRRDCQFHWHNRGYGSFDDFLATFPQENAKKRGAIDVTCRRPEFRFDVFRAPH